MREARGYQHWMLVTVRLGQDHTLEESAQQPLRRSREEDECSGLMTAEPVCRHQWCPLWECTARGALRLFGPEQGLFKTGHHFQIRHIRGGLEDKIQKLQGFRNEKE